MIKEKEGVKAPVIKTKPATQEPNMSKRVEELRIKVEYYKKLLFKDKST